MRIGNKHALKKINERDSSIGDGEISRSEETQVVRCHLCLECNQYIGGKRKKEEKRKKKNRRRRKNKEERSFWILGKTDREKQSEI